MEWQPIETAPKDGTDVLLFGDWAGEINGMAEKPSIAVGTWTGGASDYGPDGWWYLPHSDGYACWMKATAWMPLPKPPAV